MKKYTPYLFIAPVIFILIILMLYPIIKVFSYSLYDNILTVEDPQFIGFKNYQYIINDDIFQLSFANTFFFTVISVFFHLVLGMVFSLILNSSELENFIVKSIFRAIYILPWLFTAAVVAILWRLILEPYGIFNYIIQIQKNEVIEWFSDPQKAFYSVIFVNIWAGYPFHMISLLAALQSVPQSIYEAAIIDGASDAQRFWYITIPSIKPVILSISLLDTIWTMQLFPLIWMTTGGGPIHATEILATFTYKKAFNEFEYALAATSSVAILLISVLLSCLYIQNQKQVHQ